MKLQKDLREFIELLNSHGVEYLLMGGHAVSFHGYPRFTGDIDFLVRPNPENAARVLSVLADFGFESLELAAEDFTTAGRVVQLGLPPNRIDLLTEVSGVSFDEAWSSRVPALLDGLSVEFPSLPVLLRNKDAAGRPKDVADAAVLRARNRPSSER